MVFEASLPLAPNPAIMRLTRPDHAVAPHRNLRLSNSVRTDRKDIAVEYQVHTMSMDYMIQDVGSSGRQFGCREASASSARVATPMLRTRTGHIGADRGAAS
jgi:hypothetical protein